MRHKWYLDGNQHATYCKRCGKHTYDVPWGSRCEGPPPGGITTATADDEDPVQRIYGEIMALSIDDTTRLRRMLAEPRTPEELS